MCPFLNRKKYIKVIISFYLIPACVELYQFVSGSFKHYSQIQRSAHQSSAETREYPSFAILEITFVVVIDYKKKIIIIPAWQIYMNERGSKYTMGFFFSSYM